MPLPTFVFMALGVGVAAAFAGGNELRLSPRHALLTTSFLAFACYLTFLLVPASAYFYVFHGDWFLLYTIDVRRIPSAVALLGFMFLGGLGVVGFSVGAGLARSQRTMAGWVIVALCAVAAAALGVALRDRLLLVGTHSQFRGGFGLKQYGGTLLHGALAISGYLVVGTAYLLFRVRLAGRRG